MPLAAGTCLGPYEIVAPLGAGGMGEVFRAKDTRLGRDVAVKVLPHHLSDQPEIRARFEREAKTVSSLNHPHICTLFDVGRDGDTDYLVMELVEGETLAQRLEKGPLPGADVLRLGGQIADALDRAHRAGVIHRDLKPGNIMLTRSGAKLMDFGLARTNALTGPTSGSGATMAALTQHPTMVSPLTAEGTIIGTFQYMAPEQLEGRDADARSDLWALGCVLYEMATGRRAFEGRSQASLITSIMGSQPAPISQLAPLAPPGLERLVQACLAKDPADRLQSAHDIRMQLAWLSEGGSQPGAPAPVAARRRSRERLAWMLAAAGLVASAGLAGWTLVSRGPEPEVVQTIVEPPPEAPLPDLTANVAISPDGRTIAFIANGSVWVRPLGSQIANRLEGTDGAWQPFWSPDSRDIAYFSEANKLVRVPASGGTPEVVCDVINPRGGSWNRDGTIVFAHSSNGPLMRVAAVGGEPAAATTLDSTRGDSGHRYPSFLPDGDHFLFAVLPGGPAGPDTYVGSLRSRTVKRLLGATSVAVYAEPGYLLFERDGRVMAQPFDTRRLELRGEATPIADAAEGSEVDAPPAASASRNGRLAILRNEPADTRLELFDDAGRSLARYDLPPGPWRVSSVAPDGKRAAVFNGRNLWIVDLERSMPMRFATSSSNSPTSVWSPDGSRIAFTSKHEGREEIHIAGMDGRVEPVPTTDDEFKYLIEWSSDGRRITFNTVDAETHRDIWYLVLDGERKAVPYLRTTAIERGGRVSPDGRWMLYVSNESGQDEIYVQSFPEPGHKVRLSASGGLFPRWGDAGGSVYYNHDNAKYEVPVTWGETPRFGTPREVHRYPIDATGGAAMPTGGRQLLSIPTRQRPRDIRLILNWTALLAPRDR